MVEEDKRTLGENQDPNITAFRQALENGALGVYDPETWLAWHGGELIGSNSDRGKLIEEVYSSDALKKAEGALITQAKAPRVVNLRGFFHDPDGGLHRGVPTRVYDEEGNEIPVFREHNTGTVYPREE